jgi:hypothetical protein
MALIGFPRRVPGANLSVDAFHFTTLDPLAPALLLNVEIDDYGIIETRACGCPLEALGLALHLREIRSFRKLTGEGVTLVGAVMEKILHETLPCRFGGSSLSYQLVEEEVGGLTKVVLLVSPEVNIPSEGAVIEAVTTALRASGTGAAIAGAMWTEGGTLSVRRTAPVWTDRGKLLPLHLSRQSPTERGPSAAASAADRGERSG